jgi:hypothetical protein
MVIGDDPALLGSACHPIVIHVDGFLFLLAFLDRINIGNARHYWLFRRSVEEQQMSNAKDYLNSATLRVQSL